MKLARRHAARAARAVRARALDGRAALRLPHRADRARTTHGRPWSPARLVDRRGAPSSCAGSSSCYCAGLRAIATIAHAAQRARASRRRSRGAREARELGADRHPRDAAQPDLSRRACLEPLRVGEGSRDAAGAGASSGPSPSGCAARRALAHRLRRDLARRRRAHGPEEDRRARADRPPDAARPREARPRRAARCGTAAGRSAASRAGAVRLLVASRPRAPSVCASTLRVPRRTLEARVLGGLREMLTPERVRRVVALAIEELRARGAASTRRCRSARALATVERELENVVDLAATHGASDTVRRKLDRLEAERGALEAELAAGAAGAAAGGLAGRPSRGRGAPRDLPALVDAAGPAETRGGAPRVPGRRAPDRPRRPERGFRVEGASRSRGPETIEPREIPRNPARLNRW